MSPSTQPQLPQPGTPATLAAVWGVASVSQQCQGGGDPACSGEGLEEEATLRLRARGLVEEI